MSTAIYIDRIWTEAVEKAQHLVINQARYQLPDVLIPTDDPDSWYIKADSMTDEQTWSFLRDKDIIKSHNLLQLVSEIGLATLYDEDNVDAIADYITQHKDDCAELYEFLLSTD